MRLLKVGVLVFSILVSFVAAAEVSLDVGEELAQGACPVLERSPGADGASAEILRFVDGEVSITASLYGEGVERALERSKGNLRQCAVDAWRAVADGSINKDMERKFLVHVNDCIAKRFELDKRAVSVALLGRGQVRCPTRARTDFVVRVFSAGASDKQLESVVNYLKSTGMTVNLAGNVPTMELAVRSAVFFYSGGNGIRARELARGLTVATGNKFQSVKGVGKGVDPSELTSTFVVHFRADRGD